ncbi:Cold-regulated 413 protein [Dioscorea alata]|uniref:Cold-regulated 413 protein n=1 Tax=Dioscorea alata TaxID=55571 RepID=A0ACB7WDY4_DIOAL|nr:Cold-regulated 413 protein [Dioscorea alata]
MKAHALETNPRFILTSKSSNTFREKMTTMLLLRSPTAINPRISLLRSSRFGAPSRLSLQGMGKRRGTVCLTAPLSLQTLQWVSAVSAGVLMFAKGTVIQKSFLVPLFALQAPFGVISWIKGEYGTWTAFLALLLRLFYFIPGELDLPFFTMLFVIIAPYQAMNLRGTQTGVIVSLAIAGYLAFRHFSTAGSLRKAFDEKSVIASLAIICLIIVPCFFLF